MRKKLFSLLAIFILLPSFLSLNGHSQEDPREEIERAITELQDQINADPDAPKFERSHENDLIRILSKRKKGKSLSDADTKILSEFLNTHVYYLENAKEWSATVELPFGMKVIESGLKSAESIEKAGVPLFEYKMQFSELAEETMKMVALFEEYGVEGLVELLKNPKESIEIIKQVWSIAKTATEVIKEVSGLNDLNRVNAQAFAFITSNTLGAVQYANPHETIELLRNTVAILRNHGGVPHQSILSAYFMLPETPVFPSDFDHFSYHDLINHLDFYKAIEGSNVEKLQARQESLADYIVGRFVVNLRQIEGLALAGVPSHVSNSLIEKITGSLMAIDNPELILTKLIDEISTIKESNPRLAQELSNKVRELIDIAQSNQKTKVGAADLSRANATDDVANKIHVENALNMAEARLKEEHSTEKNIFKRLGNQGSVLAVKGTRTLNSVAGLGGTLTSTGKGLTADLTEFIPGMSSKVSIGGAVPAQVQSSCNIALAKLKEMRL